MKPVQSVVYSFFLGGVLALIAQALLVITSTYLADTPFSFFIGGSVLALMGCIGCVLAGFANYQYFEKWCTMGALLCFSGFAMAVGMKMVGPWTREKASLWKSIWPGLWLVIWFNVVGAVVCILFGYVCTMAGVTFEAAPKITTNMIFPLAFLMGGLLSALFQALFVICKSITSKAAPVWILMTAWMVGAIITPFGLGDTLANTFGEGFTVMIPVGGYNMYHVGMAFAQGEIMEGLVHLGSFLLAVFFLFFTGLMTFIIYNAKFGRKPIDEVHFERAQKQVNEYWKKHPEGKIRDVNDQEEWVPVGGPTAG